MKPVPLKRTEHAYLPSKGYPNGKPTLHEFVGVRPHFVPGVGEGIAVIYRCLETDEERIWGFEDGLLS